MSDDKRSCTCGECFEGWLSPTMRECLEYSTEVRYGLAKSLLDTQDGVGEDITSVLPIDYARIDNSVFYLPTAVRDKIGPSASGPGPSESASASASGSTPSGSAAGDAVYRGYVAVFKAIKDLVRPSSEDTDAERKDFPTVSIVAARLAELRAPSSAPSSASASASAAPKDTDTDIAAFLDGGGQAAHALDCIVDRAREELTPLGREYDAERRYIDAMFASEYTACANDRDFALVRARLGLPARSLAVFPEDEDEEDLRDPPSDDEE